MKRFFIFDTNSIVHRFFHALPPFTALGKKPVGALYGLASFLVSLFKDDKPDYIAAAFDRPEETFRDLIYKEYKIHRPPTAVEIVQQIQEAHNLLDVFKIKTFEMPGFEADDLIGTLVQSFKNTPDLRIEIFSSDSDILQLVDNDKVVVRLIRQGLKEAVSYNEAAVEEKFGIKPCQLPDFKGLVGDASDNIPGLDGVGPKTATDLLREFKSIEEVYDNLGLITKKTLDKINEKKEQALFSKNLATIKQDVRLALSGIEDLAVTDFDRVAIEAYFLKFEFRSLIKRFQGA